MRLPPPVIALAAGVAQRALTGSAPPAGPLRRAATFGVLAASAALPTAAVREFRSVGTTVDPHRVESSSVLVTGGVNAITRNPMYVGLAGLLLGHVVRYGSARALVPLAGFVLAIDRWQIPAEETALDARFGAGYAAYRQAVPRWVDQRSVRALVDLLRRG